MEASVLTPMLLRSRLSMMYRGGRRVSTSMAPAIASVFQRLARVPFTNLAIVAARSGCHIIDKSESKISKFKLDGFITNRLFLQLDYFMRTMCVTGQLLWDGTLLLVARLKLRHAFKIQKEVLVLCALKQSAVDVVSANNL